MTEKEIRALKVGDRIKIKTFHYREGYRTAERKVTVNDPARVGPWCNGIAVRMFGYGDFWLRHGEILEKV